MLVSIACSYHIKVERQEKNTFIKYNHNKFFLYGQKWLQEIN